MGQTHIKSACANCGGTEFTDLGEGPVRDAEGNVIIDSEGIHRTNGQLTSALYACTSCWEIRAFLIPRYGKG